jgi:hypothetical protein
MNSQGGFMNSLAVPSNGARVRQVHRAGGFDLDCDADLAFPLFSPEGERVWVSDWDPKPVFPDQITFTSDTVFRQNRGDEELWMIANVDWKTHRAEYVRLAPASHSAHITVEVQSTATRRCHVVVSYVITAFGPDQTLLDAFSETAYAAKMRDWKQRITTCLSRH